MRFWLKYITTEEVNIDSVAYTNQYVLTFGNENKIRPINTGTEVKINCAKFYICTVMDLFSRKIVGYRLSSQNNNKLTINTFKDAFELRNRPKGLTFHSDQGSNYTSNEFADLLDAVKVGQSLSQAGTPYDNSVIEAFFSNFKQDDLNSCEFENFDELQIVVDRYIEYYNSYRPHEFLGYKTPDEVEMEYKQLENFVPF